jgi:hypothetical protein
MKKASVKPKVLHRQALGYHGQTVREGSRTTIYLPTKYMEKMKEVCSPLNISCAEWMRTIIIGVLDSSRLNKELEERK